MRTTSTRFGLVGLFALLLNVLCWPAHGQYGGGSASIQGTLLNTSANVYNGSTLTIGCTYRFTVSAPACTVANVTWSLPSGMTGVTVGSAGLRSPYVDLTFSAQAVANPQLHADVGWTCPPSGGSQPPYPPGAVDARFSLSSSAFSSVALVASANPVCANTGFTLSLGSAAGVTSVTWSLQNGSQPVTTTNASQNFAYAVSGGITAPTVYKALISGGCDPNAPPVTQTITVNTLTDGASQAAGERDVPTGNNQGTVTLTNYYGTILYWQTSQDGGASWQTVNQTTEELAYANLTATTQYRAVTSRCGSTFTSASCTVRVHAATDDISWTETTAFNLSGTVIGDSRTYVDGFGKALQSQAKNLTTKQVLATQPLYGKYGQVVGSTLAAPIPSPASYQSIGTDFKYAPTFATPASAAGAAYDYTRFDGTSTLNSPEAVNTASPGTLGWYYSTNNTLEPYVATTGYPYSRSDAMSDGSSGVSRAAGPGTALQMGSNHEVVQGSFTVRTELDDYAGIRSRLVAAAAVGGQPATLQQAALQSLSADADGKSALVFADKQGNAVMSARPATSTDAWTTATNVVEVGWPHSLQVTDDLYAPQFQATADIMVYDNNKRWVTTGAPTDVAQFLGTSQNLNQYWFYSTDPFTVTGSPDNMITYYTFTSQQREAYPFFNFYVVGGGTASLFTLGNTPTSVCHLINTVTGAEVALPSQPNGPISVAPGCYQLRIEQGAVRLQYTNYYKDISYNFYNQKGQLVESIAPNGVQQLLQNWRAGGPAGFSYTPTSAHPFSTTFEYDQQGRQTAMTEPDAGRTVFVYRTDGKLRFSQNAKQQTTGAFSYLNYDPIGRVTEAAECRPGDASFFNTRKTDGPTLEYISTSAYSDGGLGQQERRDVVETFYDRASYSFTLPSGYTPAFLAGRVAATAKLSVFLPGAYSTEISHTLYSYDDQGRTQWLVQQTAGQPARTVDYAYDAAGNARSVCYQKNTPTERFSHYYSYDADNRLSAVNTDKNDPANLPPAASASWTRQADYSYYAHGPLKRVVYGGNLQGVDYTYTAAGQLKAINDGYQQLDPGKDGVASTVVYPDFFGTALNYYPNDYAAAGAPTATTTMAYSGNYQPHYNGLVSGTVWQTPNSTLLNAYGYNYDYKDQLLQADHGNLVRNAQYNFAPDPNRYAESKLDYDPNGNIGHLQRTDGTGGTPLMNISYDYLPGTNKLNAVKDVTSGAPTISYAYDAIGQVTAQQETDPTKTKYLDYDATGKVTALYADASRTRAVARYTYNEFGQRLTQQVFPTPADQTTFTTTTFVRDVSGHELASYVAVTTAGAAAPALLYEQPIYGATRLGILRQARDQTPAEQLYELNDQLGNTRVVFRKPVVTTYVLSMEDGRVSQEKQDFPGPTAATYDAVRSSSRSYSSPYNSSSTSGYNYSVKLLATMVASQGPTKTIAAQRGDKLHLTAYALYANSGGVTQAQPGPPLATSALSAAVLGLHFGNGAQPKLLPESVQPGPNGWQRALGQVSVSLSMPLWSRTGLVQNAASGTTKPPGAITNGPPPGYNPNGSPPLGGLQYVVRKASDNSVVRNGLAQIQQNDNISWQALTLDVTITETYPVLVEVSALNYNPNVAAYFDDMTVQYTPGPVIEENHFYAYGQRIDGLSWRRTDERLYGRGYQGQNTTQDAESGYTAFELRNYDARIGRWLAPDPAGQFDSPYLGMGNNPVSSTDSDGGFSDYFDAAGNQVDHIEDGSTAQFRQTGSGINLHYEFVSYANVPGGDFVSFSGLQAAQQNLNNSNPSLQQSSNGATYCNFATQNIISALMSVTGDEGAVIHGTASQMYSEVANNSYWTEVSLKDATNWAQWGGLAMMAHSDSPHGHVATFSTSDNVAKGLIANIGPKSYTGFVSLNMTISASRARKYYIYNSTASEFATSKVLIPSIPYRLPRISQSVPGPYIWSITH